MFPTSPYEWPQYAITDGTDLDDIGSHSYSRWRNKILDAQAFWRHDNAQREIFVTSDQRFSVLEWHEDFPDAIIKNPDEAIEYI